MLSVGKAGKGRMETTRRVEKVAAHYRSEESKKSEKVPDHAMLGPC